ncbi:hypothetical protein HanIR_Chr15g0732501 [Helianthus annuus]|nr:hypothetical protein HanIR_Chr15g0732501 [Helianthus annuus]
MFNPVLHNGLTRSCSFKHVFLLSFTTSFAFFFFFLFSFNYCLFLSSRLFFFLLLLFIDLF